MRRLAIAVGLAAITASCIANRRTPDFQCSSQSDCTDDRVCAQGYCILGEPGDDANPCPPGCTSCDLADKTCRIECDSPGDCPSVACPSGYACTIRCDATGACDAIDCSTAKSCDIACTAANSCDTITCGTGECEVRCDATNACGDVDCAQSCGCDVDCAQGNCDALSCPVQGGMPCTADGTLDSVCVSGVRQACESCPL